MLRHRLTRLTESLHNATLMIEVDGITYLSLNEISKRLNLSRQTIWRWRQQGKIPGGHRFRSRQVVFSSEEVEAIRQYANRIEPINTDIRQLGLFQTMGRKV
jgi:excisionase family DNA binding protein